MNDTATASLPGSLARQEMRNYVKSGLFRVGLALTTLGFAQQFLFPDKSGTDFGAVWLGLVIAAGIGVFGIGVMTGMTLLGYALAKNA